jgi:hypothetical protein
MNKPNFFVSGAGRSGTTSLYHYLKQHPDVFMRSIKETNFFAYEGEAERSCFMGDFESRDHFPIVTLAEYLALFNGASRKRARRRHHGAVEGRSDGRGVRRPDGAACL